VRDENRGMEENVRVREEAWWVSLSLLPSSRPTKFTTQSDQQNGPINAQGKHTRDSDI